MEYGIVPRQGYGLKASQSLIIFFLRFNFIDYQNCPQVIKHTNMLFNAKHKDVVNMLSISEQSSPPDKKGKGRS